MSMSFPICEKMDDTLIENGRKLFAAECQFVKGVVAMDGLPNPDRMEICFAGRSNVGKSTLINLMGYKKAYKYANNLKINILRKLIKHGKKAKDLNETIEFILGRNF